MKIFRNVLFAVLGLVVFASCSSDDDDKVAPEGKSTVQVYWSRKSDEVTTYATANDESVKPEQLYQYCWNCLYSKRQNL